jgi:dinuclear metal center YbgI/SA1388 family protein
MPTVHEIEQFLFTAAPRHMKEDWDNVGHLCGHGDREVSRVLVALDPFDAVVEEAASVGAELIVSHHPVIFGSIQTVTDATETGRTLLHAIEQGIAIISMHTNLDSAPDGVNDCLASALGLEQIALLEAAGENYGLGRIGTVQEQPLSAFLQTVKSALGCGGLRYADAGLPVRRVAVGGGACAEFMTQAKALGCDTFVTADVKYNAFIDARDMGLNLIDAGHYQTEQVVLPYLERLLRTQFPTLDVIRSQTVTDAINWA